MYVHATNLLYSRFIRVHDCNTHILLHEYLNNNFTTVSSGHECFLMEYESFSWSCVLFKWTSKEYNKNLISNLFVITMQCGFCIFWDDIN